MDEYATGWWTEEAMIRIGGGFVKVLGQLHRKGDLDNKRRLEEAFPEYFRRYKGKIEMAKELSKD